MRIAATFIIAGMMAVPLAAQGRGRNGRIPPGHLPPAGLCQVWFAGLPPGRQPRPMSCREAERLARRAPYAHVIYGRGWDRHDRYVNEVYWDPVRQYRRDDRRYPPRRLGKADWIYRGADDRFYCRRDDGTSGLIIGGLGGGVIGNLIAPRGSKAIGTILGAGAGAALGRAIDAGEIVCR
jgi:hypothetical protein